MIICSPASRGGRTGRGWPAVAAALRAEGLDFDVAMTTFAGEATHLARGAVAEGRRLVVACGGAGTVNEGANGPFHPARPGQPGARPGILPAGSARGFRRTSGISLDAT